MKPSSMILIFASVITLSSCSMADSNYRLVKRKDNIYDYENYLRRFPNSGHDSEIALRLNSLKREEAERIARVENQINGLYEKSVKVIRSYKEGQTKWQEVKNTFKLGNEFNGLTGILEITGSSKVLNVQIGTTTVLDPFLSNHIQDADQPQFLVEGSATPDLQKFNYSIIKISDKYMIQYAYEAHFLLISTSEVQIIKKKFIKGTKIKLSDKKYIFCDLIFKKFILYDVTCHDKPKNKYWTFGAEGNKRVTH